MVARAATVRRAPNVVFVLTDDQGYGDLACHGNPYIRTPNLDALHAESTHLANYHVGPTCSPTRAGLMTGHFANSTGVWHTIGGRSLLRQDERTIAQRFSDAGYASALFGKWHLGDAYPYRPEDRGFQEVVTHGGGGVGNTPDHWANNYDDDTYRHNGTWQKYEGYCTEVWFREAAAWITRQSHERPDQPFFCFVTPNAPHSPHIVPDRYWVPYRDVAQHDPEASQFFNYPKTDQMLRFYGMVTCIDEHVGHLRRTLAELSLSHNTIFIFMTDNGSAGGLVTDTKRYVLHGFNAGMRGGKNTPYDGGHRVPFFLHWPAAGLTTPIDVHHLTANIDISPTLLELCAIPHEPADFHGRSLASLLGAQTRHSALPVEPYQSDALDWPERAVVTDSQRLLHPLKWRLSCVLRQDAGHEWRLINGHALYDLSIDPEQRHDLAAERPQVVSRLREDYETWWSLVSPRTREEIPIPIGGAAPTPVLLTSHDWRRDSSSDDPIGPDQYGDDVRAIWNQSLVRQAAPLNGHWEIDVLQPATYRFELRRWPREAGLPVVAGIDGDLKPYNHTISQTEGGYGGGRSVAVDSASLSVAGQYAATSILPGATCATFDLTLPAGPTHLETSFSGPEGAFGAYYVYVESI